MNEDKWFVVVPSNLPLLKCELGKEAMIHLWDCIREGEKNKQNVNPQLAGNIRESFNITDIDGKFFKNHLERYALDYIHGNHANMWRNNFHPFSCKKLTLGQLWVNYQYQNDFNPLHDHGGVLSFVVWMKIPTKSEEQHSIPICANSNTPCASSFQFLYTNILGETCRGYFNMDPEVEGTMLLFPSTILHQVYPFFNTGEKRISISGNIFYDVNQLAEILEK